MTFPERVVYQNALQMYKTIHCDASDYLLLLHLKSLHGIKFGLLQHIMCTHQNQDMNYSAIHLHFQGLLFGILSLLTFKTHQMSNSSKVYIWGGSEILPHNCIMQCYTDYRKYINVYQKCEFNVMTLIFISDFVHVYLAFAAQSHCHVLWKCIFHT